MPLEVVGVSMMAEGSADGSGELLAGGTILEKPLESRAEGRPKLERGVDAPVIS
jgi:hypothetical protein